MLDISIIICTYNREKYLKQTIESFLALNTFGISYELIVVDNNSSDSTAAVVDSYVSVDNHIKYFMECAQGLSFARNRGIRESKGFIVAFLDDDVEIDSNWLVSVIQPFSDPRVWCVGGKVLPFDKTIVPTWLPKRLTFILSLADYGNREKPFSGKEKPVGCNMAFKKEAFENVGMFDTQLGRLGSKLLAGEEVLLFYEILEKNKNVIYCPNAIIYHKIENKVNEKYVYDYAYWLGVSESYIDRKKHKIKYMIKKILYYSLLTLYYNVAAIIYKLLIINEHRYVIAKYMCKYSSGYIESIKD